MHKPAKDKHFIKQPWFEGGPKAMKQYVTENLRYPSEALAQKVEGTVTVRFDIDHKGDVVDAKIIGHTLGHGCDEEAIRLVKSMKFKVEKPRGLRVVYHKTMQVHFRLPTAAEQTSQELQVNYNYVEKTASDPASEPVAPSGGGYTISIGWG